MRKNTDFFQFPVMKGKGLRSVSNSRFLHCSSTTPSQLLQSSNSFQNVCEPQLASPLRKPITLFVSNNFSEFFSSFHIALISEGTKNVEGIAKITRNIWTLCVACNSQLSWPHLMTFLSQVFYGADLKSSNCGTVFIKTEIASTFKDIRSIKYFPTHVFKTNLSASPCPIAENVRVTCCILE